MRLGGNEYNRSEAAGAFGDLGTLVPFACIMGAVRHVPFPPERQLIDIGSYYGSAAKIGAELGWRPRTPLREGLERTIRYYRDHLRHYL